MPAPVAAAAGAKVAGAGAAAGSSSATGAAGAKAAAQTGGSRPPGGQIPPGGGGGGNDDSSIYGPEPGGNGKDDGHSKLIPFVIAAGLLFMLVILLPMVMMGSVAGQCYAGANSTGNLAGSLGGVRGTGVTKAELKLIRSHIYAGNKITEGTYSATVYGQPWPALEGTPDTSTGLELGSTNYGKPKYIVAMDPQRNNYGTFVYIWPNPHNWTGPFVVADTGQDGSDGVDIWEWRGMGQMTKWGRKNVKVSRTPIVDPPTTSTGSSSGAAGYGYPLAIQGERGGGVADHMARAFGNWMSDHAVDIIVPENAQVLAVGDGVIYKQSGSPRNPNANPAGWTLYLRSGGNSFSYMHLNKFFVKPGQRVKKGDVIGLSGIANGVPHLHFAATPINPELIVDGTQATGGSGGGIDIETLHQKFGIPKDLPPIYVAASEKYKLGIRGPSILAAINRIETNFGELANATSSAGAVGWMQFMPATWAAYGVDGDGDGTKDPTNKFDAIYAAANYLKASGAPADWEKAIFAYNHADWYVEDVLSWAAKYFPYLQPGGTSAVSCGGEALETGPANIQEAVTLTEPRKWVPIPGSVGDPGEVIDARLLNAAVWMAKTYNLYITQGGWQPGSPSVSHGWGTALDMVPRGDQSQAGWNSSALRLAKDLGWTPECGPSGMKPACNLVPAIHAVYYNGFPNHGDPWHNSGSPHIHISFECSCTYYSGGTQEIASWVKTFPVGSSSDTQAQPVSNTPNRKKKKKGGSPA